MKNHPSNENKTMHPADFKIESSYWSAIIILVSVYSTVSLFLAYYLGCTLDEPIYIGVGVAHVSHGVLHINPFHPFWVKTIAGIGALTFGGLEVPAGIEKILFTNPLAYPFMILWEARGELVSLIGAARSAVIMANAALALCLAMYLRYALSRGLSLVILAGILFGPTVLAHSPFATLDVHCGLLCGLCLLVCHRVTVHPSFINWVVLLVVATLGALTKFPFLLMWCSIGATQIFRFFFDRSQKSSVVSGLIVCLFSVAFITAMYLHGLRAVPLDFTRRYQDLLVGEERPSLFRVVRTLHEVPSLRGLSWYLTGLARVYSHQSRIRHVPNVMGEAIYRGGRARYFLLAMVTKESEGFLVVALFVLGSLSVALLAMMRGGLPPLFPSPMGPLILCGGVFVTSFLGLSMMSNLNIGIRHVLPVIVVIWILAGAFLSVWWHKTWIRYLVSLLLCLQAASTLMSVRTLVSFANISSRALIGTESARMYSLDSNFDWGQDTLPLLRWAQEKKISQLAVDVISSIDLQWYFDSPAVRSVSLEQAVDLPAGSLFAISKQRIRFLELENSQKLAVLRNFRHLKDIGSTIVVLEKK